MAYEFKFPDVGEGITEGEIVSWKVRPGDTVAQDQALVEIETDKAVVEIPSPKAGVVQAIHGAEGDIINVGDVLVTLEESGAGSAAAGGAAQSAPAKAAAPTEAPAEEVYTGSVVGRLEEAPDEEPPAPQPPVGSSGAAAVRAPQTAADVEILAMPSVRLLAKDLGIDLAVIRGTGPSGRIERQDVVNAAEEGAYGAKPIPVTAQPVGAPRQGVAHEAAVAEGGIAGQDAHGPIERVAFRGIRRSMAKRMAESVSKQAQVTTMDDADVTVIRHIRDKEREAANERGVHLTYLAFVVKACATALKRFPRVNAVLDDSAEEYILKHYYNIGIAVDTKHGLMVPNIKAADKKSIYDIAAELIDLVNRAEDRTLEVGDLHGGTFTITNYGALGGQYATPVCNYPEVAILGTGRIRDVPVVHDGQIVSRLKLPLSLTFDHQLIDGGEAARFLNAVIGYLEDPDLLLLEGA